MLASYLAHVEDYGVKKTSLDRIDNNGHYSKENCRWATQEVQARNSSTAHMVEYQGRTQCVKDWAKEVGIHHNTMWNRLFNLKWPLERAMSPKTN